MTVVTNRRSTSRGHFIQLFLSPNQDIGSLIPFHCTCFFNLFFLSPWIHLAYCHHKGNLLSCDFPNKVNVAGEMFPCSMLLLTTLVDIHEVRGKANKPFENHIMIFENSCRIHAETKMIWSNIISYIFTIIRRIVCNPNFQRVSS